jgi:hypothetical protein
MRAEHGDGPVRHFVELFDETRSLAAQILDDVPVVHDLVAHIDGCAVPLQRTIDDLDRADDSRTKTARLSKDDSHVLANSDWIGVSNKPTCCGSLIALIQLLLKAGVKPAD